MKWKSKYLLWIVLSIGALCDKIRFSFAENVLDGNCVTFGMCGEIGDQTETACVAHHPPKKITDEYLEVLSTFCPELIAEHGSTLCCDDDQIMDLSEKMGLAQTFIGKCPACLKNLRVAVCSLICAPNQLHFLNLTEAQPVPAELARGSSSGEDGDISTATPVVKHYVTKANLFLDAKFGTAVYESCKNVVVGAAGGNIMDMLCGKWKSTGCNPRRWFDHVGKATTGVLMMETKIHLIEVEERASLLSTGMEAFSFNTTACNEEVPDEGSCACN